MADWWWEKPAPDPEHPLEQATSYLERLLIDFIMLLPSLKNRVI